MTHCSWPMGPWAHLATVRPSGTDQSGASGQRPQRRDSASPHAGVVIRSGQQPRRADEFLHGLPEGACLIDPVPVTRFLVELDDPQTQALRAAVAQVLENPRRRVDTRTPIEGRVRVAAGPASVHHFCRGGDGETQAATRTDIDEDTIDIEDFEPEDTLPESHMYTCHSWQLVNSNKRGVCLMRDRRSVNTPMTDDLIGLQSAGREDQWAIGLVRWLSVDKTGTHRLGVELLSSNARAVSLQLDEMQTKPALGPGFRECGADSCSRARGHSRIRQTVTGSFRRPRERIAPTGGCGVVQHGAMP